MSFNIIVGQSGGPSSAINATLAGVFAGANEAKANKIYAMVNGIEGFLKEKIIDLRKEIETNLDLEILKQTPSSFLGSCRYKLKNSEVNEEDYKKIFELLNKYAIDMFFYIGGNDSMDTIKNLSEYAKKINSDIKFIGIPKTIDNDLVATDHTPGFGSAAKYIATSIKELVRDSLVYDMESVTIVEIMGRNAGWLTASAILAKGEDCEGADLIYLPEVSFDMEKFIAKVDELRKIKKSLVIAVSEGIKFVDGKYVSEDESLVDAFGHKMLSGTASILAKTLKERLGIKTRAVELNTLQRSAAHIASATDIKEAFMIGKKAIEAGLNKETGVMLCFERLKTKEYICKVSTFDINKIANEEKKVPIEFINIENASLSKECIEYLKPLIDGELSIIMTSSLPRHLVRKNNTL